MSTRFENIKYNLQKMTIDEFVDYLISYTYDSCMFCTYGFDTLRCNGKCKENMKEYLKEEE